jgi:hypothetical protein
MLTKVSYSMIVGAPLNVKDYGAKGDGVTDDTLALKAAFLSLVDNSTLIFPPGVYLYEPLIATGTNLWNGEGYLNVIEKQNVTIIGAGATIKNKSVVTYAYQPCDANQALGVPNYSNNSYGVNLIGCVNCKLEGLTYDGNRDTTYSAGVREFYSAFTITGGDGNSVLNCTAFGCAGDGISTNRRVLSDHVTVEFCYNTTVLGNTLFDVNRNCISIGGNYGVVISSNIIYKANAVAADTLPNVGIDLEWEDVAVGPVDICNISITGNVFNGVGVYINQYSDVNIGGNFFGAHTVGSYSASLQIGGHVAFYSKRINVVGNTFATEYEGQYSAGILIDGYITDVSIVGNTIHRWTPIYINSSVIDSMFLVSSNNIRGESLWGIKVWAAGHSTVVNNVFWNSSSDSTAGYYALFNSKCTIKNNVFSRETALHSAAYGIVVLDSSSIVEGNFVGGGCTTPYVWGKAAFFFGNSINNMCANSLGIQYREPDWGNPQQVYQSIDCASNTKQFLIPSLLSSATLLAISDFMYVSFNGSGNTTYDIGTYASPTSLVNGGTLSTTGQNYDNIAAAIIPSGSPLALQSVTAYYLTPRVGGSGKVQFQMTYYPYSVALPTNAPTGTFTSSTVAL